MKAYILFSVYEDLFHRVAVRLRDHGVDAFSGSVWGQQQKRALNDKGVAYDPILVFTKDLLPQCDDGEKPDLGWLELRERELGVSIQRILASERHLLNGRTYEQMLRLVEVVLREVAAAYDRIKPDFVFSSDVSCLVSYVHFILARERGVPFWCIGTARLPNRLSIYSMGFQRSEQVEARYQEILVRGLLPAERSEAERYIEDFRQRPARPPGMQTRATRPGFGLEDAKVLRRAVARYLGDPADPTVARPARLIRQRIERVARVMLTDAAPVFDRPVSGEKYVVYPIHFQPEASTLVQAPMYLDQLALIQDIARSLPIGYRLYVKEHLSNRGRRPWSFYRAIRSIPSVRLLGPDEDTWSLIRGAGAVAIITGTMGWEALLFDKPVVTFGNVWLNILPHVYVASGTPKDGWYSLFSRALTNHQPDKESLLALVAAMMQKSYPGKIHNPRTFPEVLEASNIDLMTRALVSVAGLPS